MAKPTDELVTLERIGPERLVVGYGRKKPGDLLVCPVSVARQLLAGRGSMGWGVRAGGQHLGLDGSAFVEHRRISRAAWTPPEPPSELEDAGAEPPEAPTDPPGEQASSRPAERSRTAGSGTTKRAKKAKRSGSRSRRKSGAAGSTTQQTVDQAGAEESTA